MGERVKIIGMQRPAKKLGDVFRQQIKRQSLSQSIGVIRRVELLIEFQEMNGSKMATSHVILMASVVAT